MRGTDKYGHTDDRTVPMRLSEFTGPVLEWKQTGRSGGHFELLGGGQALATLDWPRALGGGPASGRFDDRAFSFKRSGFIDRKIKVTSAPFDQEVLTADLGSRDQRILFADGSAYTISRVSWTDRNWQVVDANGAPMAMITVRHGLMRTDGDVNVVAERQRDPHLPMLIVLGWLIIVLRSRDSAAAAGAAAAT